ncbi:DUF2789 domain-containing protein [Gilvimarinus xylanilyticus]|uniref:DUF2789 domain-containing protein n=1 Tax=Gilvimarinus xylanilyticus TaxID=2944139 RepID=A0A9X2I2E4_9GAMM|nr:DUF2789 domain-containing protein [Gilvimarinus xylanilyticus]MCP8900856.1 DUF2789 domain-containing protein [Gilvimarinus xylanilyticus]
MEPPVHPLSALFDQLGLASESGEIESFIAAHRPLRADTKLAEAPFWNPSQKRFLQQAIADDADWAEVVDELDALLRH